ncbi:hypothetical protein JXB22_04065 [candidate division WOR-3 bacterium]|nr:hypothetical protein [candidate division WOR-3 bacterium]
MRTTLWVTLICGALLLIQCGQQASLSVDKTIVAPGAEITVTFTAGSGFKENAWIGIIPSNIPHGKESQNDEHDLVYKYLDNKTEGTFTFMAPGQAGSYDFRMHDTDAEGKEVASVTFAVQVFKEGATLKLDKEIYAPGEEIRVTFNAPGEWGAGAWIGIIPSDVPHGSEEENDQHDIAYRYLEEKTTGLVTFSAPEEAGAYDIRMHDTDNSGNEITSVSFEVK